jgi:hypothetical protein
MIMRLGKAHNPRKLARSFSTKSSQRKPGPQGIGVAVPKLVAPGHGLCYGADRA